MTALDVAYLKDRIDMRSLVANDLGRPYGSSKNPMMFRSPFRAGDREASFAVYPDHAFDYGDPNHRIDHIDYLQRRLQMTWNEARDYLKRLVGLPETERIEHQPHQNSSENKPQRKISHQEISFYEKNLPLVEGYLENRGIPHSVAVADKLGGCTYTRERIIEGKKYEFVCRRVAIPYVAGDQILSLEFRRDESSVKEYIDAHPGIIDIVRFDLKKRQVEPAEIDDEEVLMVIFGSRYWRQSNVGTNVFGLDSVTKQSSDGTYLSRKIPWSLIAEGALDAVSAHAYGFRTTLGFKANAKIDIKSILNGVRMKYIVQDNDQDRKRPDGTLFNPGREHALRLWNQLGGPGDDCVQIIRIPNPYKDLNDMAKAGALEDFFRQKKFRIYPEDIQF